jgi:putative RecB family exonuclease
MDNKKEQLWLSHSKMTAYVECPLYFKYLYIDKVPIHTKGNYHTALGNGVHKVLEDLYKSHNYNLDFIEKQWDIVCKEGYHEKNGVYVKPILTDPQYDYPKGESETNMLYNHGRKLLREYYHKNKHTFGINDILSTEYYFKIPIDSGNIILNGYIDRLDKTPDGTIIVTDYKTGKEKDQEGVNDDFQLSLYAFVVAKDQNYSGENIEVRIHYIKSGNIISSTRSSEDMEKLRQRVISVKNGIQEKYYEPRVGDQCKYCLYDCPLGINKKERGAYLLSLEQKNIEL